MSAAPFPPAGVAIRLHSVTDDLLGSAAWCVLLANDPKDATPEGLVRPGHVGFVCSCAPGLTWPDREGIAGILACLALDGVGALGFCNLADALRCKQRLDRGGAK